MINIRMLQDLVIIIKMDKVPSQAISKTLLVVTPLFLIVLAILHTSSELSYLFILKFINNVAGSADITFLPSTQPQISHQQFNKNNKLRSYNLYQSDASFEQYNVPLIDIIELERWGKKQEIIKGFSSRWMIPCKISSTDAIILVLNISREANLELLNKDVVHNLDSKEVAIDLTLKNKLGLDTGDIVSLDIQPKNLLNGLKLFQKYQDLSSAEEYKPQTQQFSPNAFAPILLSVLKPYLDGKLNVSESDLQIILNTVWNSSAKVDYTLKQGFYPQGIYASAISNVIIMEHQGFMELLAKWVTRVLLNIVNSKQLDIQKYVPPEYKFLIPKNQFQIQTATILIKQQLKDPLKRWTLLSVCRFNNRQEIYNPYRGEKYQQFANTLEEVPGNLQAIVAYPFFDQSLAIKFFFDSVIQIFEFVTCIIYFYTMMLIMKQVYEEKEVEVGIWRTLGAGGLSIKKKPNLLQQVQLRDKSVLSRGAGIKYSSQFEKASSFKQKLLFVLRLASKVGFLEYWLISTAISVLLYCACKLIFYSVICSKLGFTTISQSIKTPFAIFFAIAAFIGILVYTHIQSIYTNPLNETIKPVKRTFDVVKVRIIHVATFGVTLQVLLIAVMLIYYGVVSYYWIPFAVLDGQEDLQVLLFNTIFLFMIFGAIILLSILQSRFQVAIFNIIFKFSSQMRSMKLAILKNIKAKQYKNIKVAIIISIIFAFVLFFTAGIRIQIQIIQSFIQRALGSNLVFENYEKKTFNSTVINQFLSDKPGIQYGWLSKSLSRDNVSITLMSHISGQKIAPQFQVLSPSYLNSTFYQYYYPQDYMPEYKKYWQLPNSIYDGFNSIYTGQKGEESVGKFQPNDTITVVDPHEIVVHYKQISGIAIFGKRRMAPSEQVINLVVSTPLRKKLGVNAGDYYKMIVQNTGKNRSYFLRARITHSFKAGPGFDMLGEKAFMSQQQADYIYKILNVSESQARQNEKLFIKGTVESLKGLGTSIVSISPEHTQMFQIEFVSKSFSLLQKYLSMYVVLITCVMSVLVTIFIFLYTLGKCREEAEMYKMLRAIGLSAFKIRMMIFFQIIIRLIVSLLDGIILGVIFSIGFSLQIQQFLMIKTPPMDITLVSVIGIILILVFSVTIIRATRYISQKTVAETNKI